MRRNRHGIPSKARIRIENVTVEVAVRKLKTANIRASSLKQSGSGVICEVDFGDATKAIQRLSDLNYRASMQF